MQLLKYWYRSLRWHKIDRKGVTGKLVRGDKTAPASTDNPLKMFLVRLAWKKVVLATVEANGETFYVGFRNYAGETCKDYPRI